MILPSSSTFTSSSLLQSIVVWIVISLSEAVNTNFFLFSSNLIPASTGIKFLVEIAFDTLLMASNNISFLIVNFIFIPSFLLFIIVIITVEKVKNPLFSLFYNKI